MSLLLALFACQPEPEPRPDPVALLDAPMADGIYARLGDAAPWASDDQLATFARGREVALRHFTLAEGLGPAFNLTSCAGCHEKPDVGGSAGQYRSFFLAGTVTVDGAFVPATSAGPSGGVLRLYDYAAGHAARPPVDPAVNTIGKRNPIPLFGSGLLAELPDAELLKWSDPDDVDGDGITGRVNYDRGFAGRFGRKAQTVSIEGFIRGPLFNHLGLTTDPLTDAEKALLPVDSSTDAASARAGRLPGLWDDVAATLSAWAQAAAPDAPLLDDDGVADPELSPADLFDVVSFSMLLAPAQPEPLTPTTERGRDRFGDLGCASCHVPRLTGPRGALPVFSDLLLHDMGEAMADGQSQKEATGRHFRTQPLWSIAPVGPYLHDGRAATLEEAILWHGGEAQVARDGFADLAQPERDEVVEFLLSLGGRDQVSEGLLPPGAPSPAPGDWAGPRPGVDPARFAAGMRMFDREHNLSEGLGGPRFNGDSCRACHFQPVFGGAGPRDVNVTRHGVLNADGSFAMPAIGTILHRMTGLLDVGNRAQDDANLFEMRQTPHLFGLGLIEELPAATILANADPYDADGDGISGKPSWTDGDRLGRFGWKAQVPSIDEFVRDAVTAELGMTLPWVDGLTFGRIYDNDDVPDPELSLDDANLLADFLRAMDAPPRGPATATSLDGEALFTSVGCAACHVPALEGPSGPVPLYSDLLLHEVLPPERLTIEEASATMWELRTPPLWGLRATAPYLHDGAADTLAQAITAHAGEATAAVSAWAALSSDDQAALLAFLETL
jgi:CxxC motif-containing protein (DUF1111 family)